MSSVVTSGLKALAVNAATKYTYDNPTSELLECFANPMPSGSGFDNAITQVLITVPEFTSLCPLTGQPDFATIVIKYSPDKLCVESKSLKLYLMSFRNHGEFHEACVARIHNDLKALLDPHSIEVEGQFTPRGGIPFWPRIHSWR